MGWIAAFWLMAWAVVPVQVTPVTGEPFAAELLAISASEVRVRSSGVERTLKPSDISRIERTPDDAKAGPITTIALSDGSRLRAESVTITKSVATIRLRDQDVLTIPVKQLAWIRYRAPSPGTDDAWLGMVGEASPNDRLVIRRSATSIDQVAGVLSSADESNLDFEMGSSPVRAPIARLEGIIFSNNQPLAASPIIVTDIQGSEWSVQGVSLALDGTSLELTLPASGQRKLDLTQLLSIRYAGNLVWLAAETPVERKYEPLLQVPLDPALEAAWFGPTGDENRDLVLRGRSQIAYRLEPKHKVFAARIISDPNVTAGNGTAVRVRLDDQVVWNETVLPTDPARGLEIPLGKARRLTLEVDFGDGDARGDTGDVIRFLEPRLLQ